MGLLTQALEKRALDIPAGWQGRVWGMGGETPAGVDVTPDSALSYSAVFACVRVLAEDVASLPLLVYRRLQPRGKERAPEHPLYRLLHDAPNPEMTAIEFRETMMGHLALWGNGYAEKEFNRAGRVMGLWPLRPDRMRVRREGGALVYEYQLPDGETTRLPAARVMHLRGLGANGIVGYSPIALLRNAVGLGLAAEEFGSRFFGNGARPQLVLIHPNQLTPEGQENLRTSWRRQHEGLSKAHRVAVLEEGITVKEIGIPPEDAQFLQTRIFQAVEIARIYRVPPHKIQDLERATFSNIEHQSIEYVASTLAPWLVRWEQAISRDLVPEQERGTYFAEHLVAGLLRGDTISRYQAYSVGRQGGWLSANDVRELENMNPIDGGDEYLSPLNMVPAAGEEEGRGITNYELRITNGEREKRGKATAAGRRRLMGAHREAFQDAMTRVVRRETNDVKQAAERFLPRRDVGSFTVWLNEFYRDFEAYLQEALGPLYRSFGAVIAADAAREIDGDADAADVEQWAAEYLEGHAERHVRKSRRKLEEALALAVDEGVDDLTAVEGALDSWREEWPEYLAGREIVLAGNSAAATTYQANGKTKLVWETSGQDYVCAFCAGLDGAEIEIGGEFGAEGLPSFRGVSWPPLHDKCECVVRAG